ncbi:MAG: hypothetical protein VB111_07235 [Clostridiaceae bacterium]|nr:hypothetical protein [Clostridiaceae bacterium]
MNTAVLISNDMLRAVSGSPTRSGLRVKKCYKRPLPPGIVENGRIYDEAALQAELRAFFSKNKLPRRITLVVDSDSAQFRLQTVPLLPPDKLRRLVRNEFDSLGATAETHLYDYIVLSPRVEPAGGVILGTALERSAVQSTAKLFAGIGVTISVLTLSLPCVIRALRQYPRLSNKSYILTVLDRNNVSSFLFIDGIYRFSNRSRLYEERDTPAAAVELSRTLSSMVQFNLAQKTGAVIAEAYVSGALPDETPYFSDISESLGIHIGVLPPPTKAGEDFFRASRENASDYLYLIGALLG